MKNNSLFLLVAALFAIVSCGAADLYAQKRVSQYRNGIYYSAPQPVQEQPELQEHFRAPLCKEFRLQSLMQSDLPLN